jgi:Na+-transporting methylmalonyl-CoA/oxaloacetate decarboxylase gamma subunit
MNTLPNKRKISLSYAIFSGFFSTLAAVLYFISSVLTYKENQETNTQNTNTAAASAGVLAVLNIVVAAVKECCNLPEDDAAALGEAPMQEEYSEQWVL